jgi:hypothetical protein
MIPFQRWQLFRLEIRSLYSSCISAPSIRSFRRRMNKFDPLCLRENRRMSLLNISDNLLHFLKKKLRHVHTHNFVCLACSPGWFLCVRSTCDPQDSVHHIRRPKKLAYSYHRQHKDPFVRCKLMSVTKSARASSPANNSGKLSSLLLDHHSL